ncbi:hypothetical protein GCM10022419_130750 [Nonomuraea rosea]|uniref:Uncharacterized protein n=1 Tax=Nonomuraea rosea TaxID=638574 RepID=A0ABP7A189_9ACTN
MSQTMPRQAAPVERTITGAAPAHAGVEQSWIGTPGYPFAGVEQSFNWEMRPFADDGDA